MPDVPKQVGKGEHPFSIGKLKKDVLPNGVDINTLGGAV